MILDTSFVEDVTGENDDALAKAASLIETGLPERLSAMTLYELYGGASDTSSRRITTRFRNCGQF